MIKVMARIDCPQCGSKLWQRINNGEIVHWHTKWSYCLNAGKTFELTDDLRLVEIDPNRPAKSLVL